MLDENSGNLTGLFVAEEATLGQLPADPVWFEREPNSYGEFGGQYAMTTRKPITKDRQYSKGDVSDNNPTAGYNEDLTLTNMYSPLQGFLFADVREHPSTMPANGTQHAITAVTATEFQAAAGLDVFLPGHIILASGFGDPNNNGIHIASAAVAGAVTVDVADAEAAPPATARLDAVGFQFGPGELSIAVSADKVELVTTRVGFSFLDLVLTLGGYVFVGGDGVGLRFADTGNNAPFYGRVAAVAADRLTLDKTTGTQANDAGAGKSVQLFFANVVRNEDDPELIKMRSYCVERQYGIGADREAEYIHGALTNQLTVNIPTPGADAKVNCDLSYIAMTSSEVTAADGGPLSDADTVVAALNEPAFKPGVNVFRNRLAVVDPVTLNPTPLVAYNQQCTITLNNNLAGNKAIEVFGNSGVNIGEMAVSGNLTAYFNGVSTAKRVREGAELTWDLILTRSKHAVVFDLASMGLGGARANVAANEPITLPLEGTAGKGKFGYTLAVSLFRYVPQVGMANNS